MPESILKIQKTLREIAQLIDGEVIGDERTLITGISGIKEAEEGDLTFLANPRYIPLMHTTRAAAIITSREIERVSKPIVRTDNPSLAFAKTISLLFPQEQQYPSGIHPMAVIGKDVKIGRDVALQPYVVLDDGVEIGDRTIIYAGTYIGHHTRIGCDCLIYPNVAIREKIEIGNRVVIHSGSVIGSDGFGFANVKGVHHKIPQVGTVAIEDDVEIGANVTIDRARFGKTSIGRGTKIDNLVQIAHNVEIGEHSIVIAQAGISGSTIIGNNVTLAGQAGLVGHIKVGDNAVVAAQAGVTKSVAPNTCVSGYPAKPHDKAKRVNALVQRLPELFEAFKRLENKINKVE
ncbi:MAG: UDP-3-O-(3-hydroxymyristoyl)glucosamine N-acyltransferase [Candidatus Omnitrophota bacterium]